MTLGSTLHMFGRGQRAGKHWGGGVVTKLGGMGAHHRGLPSWTVCFSAQSKQWTFSADGTLSSRDDLRCLYASKHRRRSAKNTAIGFAASLCQTAAPSNSSSSPPPFSVFYLLGWHAAFALAALSIKRHLLLVIVCSPSCPQRRGRVSAAFYSHHFFFFSLRPPHPHPFFLYHKMSSGWTGRLCKQRFSSAASHGVFICGNSLDFNISLRSKKMFFLRSIVSFSSPACVCVSVCVRWEISVLLQDIS